MEEIWLVTGNDPNFRAYGFYLHLGWNPVGVETEGYEKTPKGTEVLFNFGNQLEAVQNDNLKL